jgi:recombinational DNA repair protein RecR
VLRRIAFLNLDNESNFLTAMSSLFHSLTVEGINDELVISDKLEKLQLDAARIVTGLPMFTKLEYLYAETG